MERKETKISQLAENEYWQYEYWGGKTAFVNLRI